MSGPILFLTSEDFETQQGTNGNILCHNIRIFTDTVLLYTLCALSNSNTNLQKITRYY